MPSIKELVREGRDAEAADLAAELIVRRGGVFLDVLADSGYACNKSLNRLVERHPRLRTLLRVVRRRRLAAPNWLVRTLAAIEGGHMGILSELLTAASGMTVEEIAADIEQSPFAGMVDSVQLAEAIAAGAEAGGDAAG